MGADILIGRLDAVRRTGSGRWTARCPAHSDKRPSLAIRECDDGRVLLHCFAQCSVEEVLNAIGMDWDAIMPPRAIGDDIKREHRPFNAHDILACIATEALIVAIAASDIGRGIATTDADRERVMLAASRIEAARELAHGN